MYLKELEIFGFKSFPEKTILKFEPGITVIVGPNGCGKSNILDSIRWALGEQSPKSLRGSKMEDIIFNGTEKSFPLNYAEVTLTFSNEDKAINLDFREVSITRRLFRSGESQYLLNKSQVRLKDIQELLFQIGLGEGSHSFVAQGTIENILTRKPEEKRIIFDEAAGILKFKDRKKEVLRKLEEVDSNLTRLEDIIVEVKRQRDSLLRQVQRAKKYQEIQNELKDVERKIAILKLKELKRDKDVLFEQLNKFALKEKEKDSLLKKMQEAIDKKNEELEDLKRTEEENSSQIVMANSEISTYRHRVEVNNQRIAEFRERLNNVKKNHSLYSQRVIEQQKRVELLKAELQSIDSNFDEDKNKLLSCSKTIEIKTKENKEKSQFIKESSQLILGLEQQKVDASNNLIDIQSQLNTFLSRKKRLLVELSKSDAEFGDYKTKFTEIKSKIKDSETTFEGLRRDFQDILRAIKDYQDKINDFSQKKIEKEKKLLILSSQLEFLKDLKVKYEDFPQTQEVTIILEKQLPTVPSVIIAKIDRELQAEQNQDLLRIRTQAKIIPQKISQLKENIDSIRRDFEDISKDIQNAKEEKFSTEERRRKKEIELQEKEKELLRLQEVENNFKENLRRLKEEKDLVDFELKETEQELNSLYIKEKELKENLSNKEAELKNIQEFIEKAQRLTKNNEEDIKNLEIEMAHLNTELSSLKEEKKTKEDTLNIFLQDLESTNSQIKSLDQEEKDIQNKISLQEEENKSLSTKIQSKIEDIKSLKLKLEELKRKKEDLELEKKRFLEEIKQIQVDLDQIRKNIYDKKVQVQNFDFSCQRVITDLKQLYDVEINLEEIDSQKIEIPLAQLQEQEEGYKRRLKYLGNVNLAALDEYKELNERFEFLQRQKEDLLVSRDSLKKAIAKINKTSRQMFIETFTKIQEEFRKLFRFLFRGGKSQIYLLDEENILESGIEIAVQPPEKKLQNVSLLSGGEKSLTAIALIFAIFKIKPSALYILDEIDAPLDEANVDRFNYLLSDFAKKSQFIIITHNKKTMSKADVMYGVTMQDSGVSKIVSVKFTEAQEAPLSS